MKTVFILAGDCWHSASSILPMVKMVFNDDEWDVHYTENPMEIYTLKKRPDLVISFKHLKGNKPDSSDPWMDTEWKNYVLDLVGKEGTGIILAHGAIAVSDKNHPVVKEMSGTAFVKHPKPCHMKLVKTEDHPVTEGLKEFDFPEYDEQYQMDFDENTSVNIVAHTVTEHGSKPAVWVREYANGRICCITLAHNTGNLTCDGFIALMRNSVYWCSKTNQ